jgi:hypothetical protein
VCCWKRMEKVSVKEDRNILRGIKGRNIYWICHTLCRNCLLKHVIEGSIYRRNGVTRRRGRRHKQLLHDLKLTRRY